MPLMRIESCDLIIRPCDLGGAKGSELTGHLSHMSSVPGHMTSLLFKLKSAELSITTIKYCDTSSANGEWERASPDPVQLNVRF